MRPIDADALKDELELADFETDSRMFGGQTVLFEDSVFKIVDSAPTISPDEVRGVGEITGDDACPSCGCWIPTDDAHDAIFKNEVKFCYYCGMRLRMKGAEDGATE